MLGRAGLIECLAAAYSYQDHRARDYRFALDRTDFYEKPTSKSESLTVPQSPRDSITVHQVPS